MLGAGLTVPAVPIDVSRILEKVERHYNSIRSMQLQFEQIYYQPGRPARLERGLLYLRKPRQMRWEYQDPPGKLFVSDGRSVWFYTPRSGRVEKMRLKESEDYRTPLAFLISRLEFQRFFREFRARPEGSEVLIEAIPKDKNAPYSRVEFWIESEQRIRRLIIHGQDQTRMEFRFTGERANVPLSASLFQFEPPPGVELVEISGQEVEAN